MLHELVTNLYALFEGTFGRCEVVPQGFTRSRTDDFSKYVFTRVPYTDVLPKDPRV